MKRILFAVAALMLFVAPAAAQSVRVVASCLTGVSPGLDAGSPNGRLTVDSNGKICGGGTTSQYPNSATPITGNANGTTGAVVGTLAAAASKTTYICGFNVSGIGGTAALGPITVAGLVGSSQVYQLTSSATGVQLTQNFSPCIPASAVNTAITVTTTANGTATAVNVASWGFQQ